MLIHRDQFGSFNSSAGYAYLPESNFGSQDVKGINFEMHYQLPLDTFSLKDAGSLTFDFHGTAAMNDTIVSSSGAEECNGHYDEELCPEPQPRWKHRFQVTYASPDNDYSIFAAWRYFTGTSDTYDGLAQAGDYLEATLPAESYFDLGGNWNFSEGFTVYGGINNVLNQKPPLIDAQLFNAATDNANTFPGLYDALGTDFFAGVKVKF
jgi:outer membrane receptor protein involved in Fe transport